MTDSRRAQPEKAGSGTVTSDDERRVLEAVPKDLLTGGEWRAASSGATFPIEDPSTGDVLAHVANADATDAAAALGAADSAQATWARCPPRHRGEILRRTFELLAARQDDLALLMTLEMGKPVAESRAEIAYAAEFFRWFSEEAVRIDGRYAIEPGGNGRLLVMQQPVGPCLLITPWNFPAAMAARKVAPAVAAGCTMVLKPAALTPLSSLALAGILLEAGLPEGVLNVVPTTDAGGTTGPLLSDPRLRKLSFTGSTEVGRRLLAAAAPRVLRVSMELGGNAPFLVYDDADLAAAVEGAMVAKLRNGGEACTAANRFHVHRRVADEFAERLADRFSGLRVGRGTEPDVNVGPLVDDATLQKVSELVDDARDRGARVLVGGERVGQRGYFYMPTVMTEVAPRARVLTEEIFGPVAPITQFADEDEAIRAANDTEYGLVAFVYTRDLNRAIRAIEGLETGMVGLNRGIVSNPAAPFGGVKQSGLGREGGSEGIREYLETKYVAVDSPG